MNSEELALYVATQIGNFFPDGQEVRAALQKSTPAAYERVQYSIGRVKLPGYTVFSVLHSDLYAQFLYYLSNSIWETLGERSLAAKLFYLNKSLHGINCMYDTKLPDVFLLIHTVGTVLGKAKYNDYMVICQNVTVGADRGAAPEFGRGVYLGPSSAVVGATSVGAGTRVALHAVIRNETIPESSVVSGRSPTLKISPSTRDAIFETYFKPENKVCSGS